MNASLVPPASLIAVTSLFLAGCSSSDYSAGCYPSAYSYRQVAPPPAAQPTAWHADDIGTYTVGRAVDPRDPNVLHEAHTVYRREQTSRPNLIPPAASGPSTAATTAGDNAMRDALNAELHRQRAASMALIQEAQALNERMSRLNTQIEEMRQSAQDAAGLRVQHQAVTNRLAAVEAQLRQTAAPTPAPASASKP